MSQQNTDGDLLCAETIDIDDDEDDCFSVGDGTIVPAPAAKPGWAQSAARTQEAKRTYWFLTINNYSDQDIQKVRDLPTSYTVCGYETAPTTGTPHIHVVFRCERPYQVNFKKLKRMFPTGDLHYFRASDFGKSVSYCKKKNNYFETGEGGPEDRHSRTQRGNTKQLQRYADAAEAAKAGRMGDIPADLLARHSSHYDDLRRQGVREEAFQAYKEAIPDHTFKPWQADLHAKLLCEPTRGRLWWLYDPQGQAGKSWFASWYEVYGDAAEIILPGKAADMAHAITPNQRVYFFDLPRTSGDKVAWGFLEQLSNGVIFSSKYNSTRVYTRIAHIVVLANQPPPACSDTTGFSQGRIVQIDLSNPLPWFNP